MNMMEICWKNIFLWSTIPLFSHIPVPTNTCSSGVLENNLDALYEVLHNKTLRSVIIWYMISTVVFSFISLFFIKMTNAMQKVMLQLIKTVLVWVFFMLWPGEGHENFNIIKLLGMILLSFGTFWYIWLDLEDIEKEAKK